jgi:hypothetical protein
MAKKLTAPAAATGVEVPPDQKIPKGKDTQYDAGHLGKREWESVGQDFKSGVNKRIDGSGKSEKWKKTAKDNTRGLLASWGLGMDDYPLLGDRDANVFFNDVILKQIPDDAPTEPPTGEAPKV